MWKEKEVVKHFVALHPRLSREDAAIELAAAAVAVSREYKKLMYEAIVVVFMVIAMYSLYRIYTEERLYELDQKLKVLEGKCTSADNREPAIPGSGSTLAALQR